MIREFEPEDFEGFRKLRLTALQTDPAAFASSYEEERERPLTQVHNRFLNDCQAADVCILGAFVKDEWVGMMGLVRHAMQK